MVVAVQKLTRLLRAGGAAALLACSAVALAAEPAGAHATGGLRPSNYQTVVRGISPRVRGLEVRPVDLGTQLELRNESGREVVVLGYDGEPYLRIGARGVLENSRSPATYLNRTASPTGTVPSGYDSRATPRWKKVSSDTTARWHDHRSHWMGTSDPPIVQRDPGRPHTVIEGWQVPLERDGRPIVVEGDVLWVPAPSPVYWLLGALACAGAVIGAARTPAWRVVLGVALAVLLAATAVDVIGVWGASSASGSSKAAASAYSVAAWIVAAAVLVWLCRASWQRSIGAVMFVGMMHFVVSGLGNLPSLFHSQLPTTAPADLTRAAVTGALGAGAGLVIAAATRLRPAG